MRPASLALLGVAATFSLSGCHEMVFLSFEDDPDDPPLHMFGPRPIAAASAGRAFTGRADGQLASRMKITHGYVKSKTSWARFIGNYKSDLAKSPLASAQWHGRFRSVRNRSTGRYTVKGLVLATFNDASAGRACLSLRSVGRRAQNRRPRRAARSVVTVLGGEGDAKTLRGTATVRVRLARDNSFRLRGRARPGRGEPRRFTPACTKLERRFGLAPIE